MTIAGKTVSPLPILSRMGSLLDLATKIVFHISGLALLGILCLIVNEVSLRYFFNSPTTWAGDANQWLFAMATTLALPEITRVNGNVAITILLERMPSGRRELYSRFLFLISCVACFLALYISGVETMRQYNMGITTNWIYPVPKWWVSVTIPVGFLLSSFQFLRLMFSPQANPSIEA